MKSTYYLLAGIFIVVFLSFKYNPLGDESSRQPVITFEETSYEFGTVKEGEIVEHKFYFKNTGNGTLNIKNATSSCGCTYPSYPFMPIGPGETGYIGVSFNTTGKFGMQKPTVKIYANTKEKVHKIYMIGRVNPNVRD